MLRVFAKKPHAMFGQTLHKRWPVFHGFPDQVLPVIQSSPAQVMFVYAKPERAYKPELGVERKASPADIPSILWNLGLMQDNMIARFIAHDTIMSITRQNARG